MSLIRLLKLPLRMFKKESISFVIIRRHDLGILNENLTYIAVRPHCNISTIRFKLWHLLDLPDYCDEVILLRTFDNVQIPLTELKRGNNPRKPFILEVWMPGQLEAFSSVPKANNMLNMVENEDKELTKLNEIPIQEIKQQHGEGDYGQIIREPKRVSFKKFYTLDSKRTMMDLIESDYDHSEISGKFSRSSIFFKMHPRMSRDNLATMLMKIQSDLSTLSHKIGSLESKIKC